MNTATEDPVTELLRSHRNAIQRKLALIEKADAILRRLPADAVECATLSDDWIQFCSPSRETVEGILRTLGAGRMEKAITVNVHDRIDYRGFVDGVEIVIHRAEPPRSCRIIETPEYVPAHNRVKRTLVCH